MMPNTPMIRSANANCSFAFILLTFPFDFSLITCLPQAEVCAQPWQGEFKRQAIPFGLRVNGIYALGVWRNLQGDIPTSIAITFALAAFLLAADDRLGKRCETVA
jgi:hypothetical protein